MPTRIKFWLFGTAFTLSTIISPLLLDIGGVAAVPVKETKETKQPSLIDRLIFHFTDRKSTRLNSSHPSISRMPSSA